MVSVINLVAICSFNNIAQSNYLDVNNLEAS